ncbi:MAG TPA: OmpA family protein [Sphingobacteriaceae bacterium]|nr:OmpA family protein [Sphingobacteriaceae bacterium]
MISNYLKTSAIVLTMLVTGSAYAQDVVTGTYPKPFSPASSFRTWSIGLNGGALTPTVPFGKNDFTNWETNIGYGAYIKKQILPALGIQANFLRGKLNADNTELLGNGTKSPNPFKSYETEVHYAGSLTANLSLANIYWMNRKSVIQPFITGGAGMTGYNPILLNNAGASIEFKPGSEDVKEVFFPLGAGLKVLLSESINLDLGYTMNFVDADNLDGYHSGSQNDKFSYGHIGLEFALGSKSKPQLATYNPVAALEYDYIMRNKELVDQLATERSRNADQLAQMATDWARFKNDEDKDGVSDYFDKCPGTPVGTQVDGAGCPITVVVNNPVRVIVTEEDRRVVAEAIRNLEFDFGKATIRSSSYPSLNRVADLLKTKDFSLKLAGHTDNVGSDAANLKLSKDRAESVKSYLVSQGANSSRIEATGYGESQPIATNKTDAGRQQNRRVEFTLY